MASTTIVYLKCFNFLCRMLEEGNLDAAEEIKLNLEQAQRERRKTLELEGVQHEPQWFK